MNKTQFIARKLPGVYPTYRFLKFLFTARRTHADRLLEHYPAGHFHSPLPDLEEILSRADPALDMTVRALGAIELRQEAQLEMLDKLSAHYRELPFPDTSVEGKRFYYLNDYFSYGDAIVLYAMIRHFKPKRIVEIGCGFSSAVMLDTNDAFMERSIDFTFIEPGPERLYALAKPGDDLRSHTIEKPVQEVDLSVFEELEDNDFLSVDSSHVVKTGSDVAHIVHEILPRLRPGVVLQFHDVFWPFEYPKEWIAAGRAWNEAYLLRAFLQFNRAFQIICFNSFIALFHRDELENKMPLCLKNPGASLWLRKEE